MNAHNLLTDQSSDKEVAMYALKQITLIIIVNCITLFSIKTHNKHTFSECDAKQRVRSSLPMYDCLHK